MRKFFQIFSCMIFSSFAVSAGQIDIVPKPLKCELTSGGKFSVSPSTQICVATKDLVPCATLFATQVEKIVGFAPKVVVEGKSKKAIRITIDPALTKEEYKITVTTQSIDINGGSAQGAFHAMQSLRQMITQCKQSTGATIPAVVIEDEPFFEYRAMMLDVCRHFSTVDEVKHYIDILSLHKLNTFHWHLTDDQGWRIAIDKYPKLTEIGTERAETVIGHARTSKEYDGKPYGKGMYYTKEQIRDVIKYASERYIEILPEVEMPGHALAALAAYPELGCVGKGYKVSPTWGIFDDVFCAGNEQTYKFLEDVLSEVIEMFPSQYIHIGGDECPKVRWEVCPACQKKIKENNLADEHALQSYLVNRMEKFVRSKGKSIVGWEEILEGGASPTATIMSWKSNEAGIEAAKSGNKVIMVPAKNCYFDYYQAENKDKEPFAIGGYVPVSKVYEFDPYQGLNPSQQKAIWGVQANLWREYISSMSHIEYMVLPRMAALSELGWSHDRKQYDDFLARMQSFRKLYDVCGYNYAKHIFN